MSGFEDFENQAEQPIASVGSRFLGYFIDAIVYMFMFFVILMLLGLMVYSSSSNSNDVNPGILGVAVLFYVFGPIITLMLYYTLMEHKYGKTLGKMAAGIRVVNMKGENPTLSEALIRSLCRLIPFEFISIFIGEGLMWHDQFSKTKTIQDKK